VRTLVTKVLTAILFLLAACAPVILALKRGDALLDFVAARRRNRARKSRRKKTLSLPVQTSYVERLVTGEIDRDRLDEKIAEGLQRFARIPPADISGSETELERLEKEILVRESKFNAYLDCAWLQSETLEVLSLEVSLLRELADLPADGLPSAQTTTEPQAAPRGRPRKTPADKLFANLNDAVERKSKADRALKQVGTPPSPPGTSFDATIGDDETS